MRKLETIPNLGGLNQDDNIENLHIHDYQEGVNLYPNLGNDFLEKLNGVGPLLIEPYNGTLDLRKFFGMFEFPEFYIIFSQLDSLPHALFIWYKNDLDNIYPLYEGEFDIDDSIYIKQCVLVNNKMIVFNNGVDEIMKVHIDLSDYGYLDQYSESFGTGIVGENNGYLTLENLSGLTNFGNQPASNNLYSLGLPTDLGYPFTNLSPLANYVVEGNFTDATTFQTDIEIQGFVPYLGDTVHVRYNDLNPDFKFKYRGHKNEHYLINTPHRDRPEVVLTTDTTKQKNNIREVSCKFQIQYLYNDNSLSAWSPISDELIVPKANSLSYFSDNGIQVMAKNPLHYDAYQVKTVIFGVRIDDGILYEFDRVDVIRKISAFEQMSLDISTVFFNDTDLIPVDESQANSLFDYIFPRTNSIELVDNSVLTLSGINWINPKTEVLANINVIREEVTTTTPSDYIHGFQYSASSNTSKNETLNAGRFGSSSTALFLFDDTFSKTTENKTFAGDVSDAASPDDVLITDVTTSVVRYREASSERTHAFLEFSPTQTLATVYRIRVVGNDLSARDYSYRNNIFDFTGEFAVKTTNTQDLIDEITDWFENQADVDHGHSGDTVQFFALDQDEGTGGQWYGKYTILPNRKSIVLSAGLNCIHNKANHYHWHQVKQMTVTVEKISFVSKTIKSMKSNASHSFIVQHYDKFNRILSNDDIGELNIPSFIGSNGKDYIYNKLALRLFNNVPSNAVKAKLLYGGSNEFQNNTFLIAETVVDSGDIQTITFSFSQINERNGYNLAYTFTEGDLIARRRSFSGGSYTNLTGSDTNPTQVLSQDVDAGTIRVTKVIGNEILAGDLLEITSHSLDVESTNKVFYEVGNDIQITNGNYVGEKTRGSNVRYNLQVNTVEFFESNSLGYTDMTSIESASFSDVAVRSEMKRTGIVEIHSGVETVNQAGINGIYEIIDFTYLDTTTPRGNGHYGVVVNLLFSSVPSPDVDSFLYFGDRLASTELSTEQYTYSEITVRDIGDAYLRYRAANFNTIVESFYKSDKNTYLNWAKGRPSLLVNTQVDLGSSVFHSQPFYDNTILNGLSTVYGASFEQYNSSFGDILATKEKDNVMYLFREEATSYILIGKNQFQDPEESALLTASENVISKTEQFLQYEQGIGNQLESILSANDMIYFADNIKGVICELRGRAIKPISKIKMDDYFTSVLREPGANTRMSYDFDRNLLIVHIKTDTRNEQLVFDTVSNRWKSKLSLNVEYIGHELDSLFTVSDVGDVTTIHKLNDTSQKLNFKGTQLTAEYKKTFNTPDNSFKSWLSLAQDPLFADTESLLVVLENDEGQVTDIVSTSFERDGTKYWAEILRDKNTPEIGSLNPLYEGDEMQAKTLTVTLKSNSQTNTPIKRIEVRYIDLENDPK